MRIPGTKVWRAFPELDRFSDAECERFVERATAEHQGSKSGVMALGCLGLVIAVPLVIWLGVAAWSAFSPAFFGGMRKSDLDVVEDIAKTAFIAFLALGCSLTMLVVRDRWLIHTITRKVQKAACAGCGYSLLGLQPDHGVVVCPECSTPLHLRDAGLSEEDLMVGDRPRGTECARCGYSLGGLQPVNGVLTCPECSTEFVRAG
ncbi:MAG TPA: hypothetical protein VD997_12090 [Phycisphaerales bacterium]|nr:hypothetical protein [Phycisphaerales bacterium]